MVPRTIICSVLWTLRQDVSHGAPVAPVHQSECATCGDRSPAAEGSRVGPEVWALIHTGRNPSHRDYRATSTTMWRAFPTDPATRADTIPAEPPEPPEPPRTPRQITGAWVRRVRMWAHAQGAFVSDGGPLPELIVDAYLADHPDDPRPPSWRP
ncbi:DUF7848 domain-containing protein [Streptomyces sp. NPDC055094]